MIIRVKKKTHIIIVNFGYILIIFENNSLTLQIDYTDYLLDQSK